MHSRETAVSADAVVKRVDRRVKGLGIALKAMRPGRRRAYLGRFYIVGPDALITDKHVDPERTARELRVPADDEEVRSPNSDVNDVVLNG